MITVKASGGDDTAAIQAALDTGDHVFLDSPVFKISNSLIIRKAAQMLSGNGRTATDIRVSSNFNMNAQAVIVFATGEEGPVLRDFCIDFMQPITSNRNDLIRYPVAIRAVGIPRFTIENVNICNATNGIDMTGNTGGAFMNLLEMSAYEPGIKIDGALDTIRVNQFHFWPFEMAGTLNEDIFFSPGTVAMDIGRVDGLFISEFLNISNLGLRLRNTASGSPWVYMSDSGFDSFNGIDMAGGSLQVVNSYITLEPAPALQGVMLTGGFAQFSNCYFATSQNTAFMLMQNMSGGSLQVDNCYFNTAATCAISVGGNTSINSVQVSNCRVEGQTPDFQFLVSAPAAGAANNIHLSNNVLQTAANMDYHGPIIHIGEGNRAYISGNRVLDKGTGNGIFITIPQDNFHMVTGNMAPGWPYGTPGGPTGFYGNNI